jgi:ATP-binding cassette subfamily E protein 1
VGVIGPNGTGKTTALRILAGELQPNLSQFGETVDPGQLARIFRGTEVQAFLERLGRGEITISAKPQRIDLIPRVHRGRVGRLLGRADQRGALADLVRQFELEAVMDKRLSELSGGELQLVAIAATIVKDANFFFFDEPSSYLDVRQRLLAAKAIRGLIAKERYVLVVEHDLAILDYLADRVHLIYGVPGVYGIVSKPYSVRRGINVYLEGYIREDNVRFRPEPIHFEARAPPPIAQARALLKFGSFDKRWDGFELKTESGEVCEGEIIGVLGPNATGKTTFVRMLAGDIQPDVGKVGRLRISYKPQRLKVPRRQLVRTYLKREIGNVAADSTFRARVRGLEIDRLMDRLLTQLSGGERQVVAIVAALGKECDVLLLDEPCAFLDVEKRLALSRILRRWVTEKGIAAFVVDHDIQFIDALSDRLMIFEGIPGVSGRGRSPTDMRSGMNRFLAQLDVTFRRDPTTGRARANKPGSVLDREQKRRGEYFYL